MKLSTLLVCPLAGALVLFASAAASAQSIFPFLPPTVSTIPSNGDVNPYGVAFVPKTVARDGVLQPGDVLVSNFNNNQNLQGTGTTITRVDKAGNTSTFFTSPANQSGLSAALGVLSNGLVLIGNLPTADGTSATAQAGRLAVLDRFGNFLGTIGNAATIDGPWGMAVYDSGNGSFGLARVFVSNVLNGTVLRIDIKYSPREIAVGLTVIASGLTHRGDPAALELGPSGLAFDPDEDTLYVASSSDNAIYKILHAAVAQGPQTVVPFIQDLTHLHGPLDLALLPNEHLVVANSDGSNADPNQPSELVEYSEQGTFLGQMPVDPNNGGAFGVSFTQLGGGVTRLAAVDDNANTLNFWTTTIVR